jgi:hypothetical protein
MKSYDPTDIRSQETAKEGRDRQTMIDRQNEEEDFKWLMGTKRGRRIVWRLLDQAGVFRLSFDPNAMRMAFAEGNRNFGNKTLAMIHALCPELYHVMTKEQTNGRRNPDDTATTQSN